MKLFQAIKIIMIPLFVVASHASVLSQVQWRVGTLEDSKWVLRKGEQDQSFKRFFAIGIMGIPDYTPTENIENFDADLADFTFQTNEFNLIYVAQRTERKTHFKNKPIFSGWSDINYLWARLNDNSKGFTANDGFITYEEMFSIRNGTNGYFESVIDQYVTQPLKTDYLDNGYDLIWYLYDEPDRGSTSWSWAPEQIKILHDKVKLVAPNSITFLDLGPVEGSIFLLEDMLKRQNKSLPPILNDDNIYGDGEHYCEYFYTSSGEPIYRYHDSCQYQSINFTDYLIAQNVKRAVSAYGATTDVLGINSYGYFNQNPKNVGLVMNAIREVRPNQPIWLFFQAYEVYNPGLKNLRCQVFTSIIHGATGVLFYNNSTANDYWYGVKVISKELNDLQEILISKTTETSLSGNLRYIVKTLPNGDKHLIATNLGTTASTLAVNGFPPIIIDPMEVVVYPYAQKILGLFSNGTDFIDKSNLRIQNPITSPILSKTISSFDISAVKFMTTGDFNGDGKEDILLLYKQSDSQQKIIILHSYGTGNNFRLQDRWGRSEPQITLPNDAFWLTTPNSFDFDAVKFVTSGDFDGNGNDDLVVFYRQTDQQHKIIVLLSNDNGFGFEDRWGRNETTPNFNMPLNADWLNTPNSFEFEAVKFVTSGDFDGNGNDDLVVFYRQADQQHKIIVLHSNDAGTGFEDRWGRNETTPNFNMPLNADWLNTPNSFEFEAVKFVTSGDFGGNGNDDLVVFYRQADQQHKIIVLISNDAGTGFEDRWGRNEATPNFNMPLNADWLNTPHSFEFDAVKFVTSGDFDGNGHDDLVVFYNQADQQQKIIVLHSNDAGTGFEDRWGRNETTPNFNMPLNADIIRTTKESFDFNDISFTSCADLNGDGKDDLVILYDNKPIYYENSSFVRKSTIDKIVSDKEVSYKKINFTLYPNPSKGLINFDIEDKFTPFNIEVYDTKGQLIETVKNFHLNDVVNLSKVHPGVYLVKIFLRDDVLIRKVIIE